MRFCIFAALVICAAASTLHAAGFVYSANFFVLTAPQSTHQIDQAFAQRVLEQAEAYRKSIALEWIGEQLSPGIGRTIINIAFSDNDEGLTWAIDDPRRVYHTIYLSTTPRRSLGSTLAHEMVHVVLATSYPYPNRLPAWLEEGIASRYDDAERIAQRQTIIHRYAQTNNWPNIERVLRAERIRSSDLAGYAIAASLSDFLLSRSSRETVLRFGSHVTTDGLEQALRKHYGFADLQDLGDAWRTWAYGQAHLATNSRVAEFATRR